MSGKYRLATILFVSVLLTGCSSTTAEPVNINSDSYEYRIMEDPSTGILTAFYEKDGNLYYKQITNAHTDGNSISLSEGGWTEMKPPADIEFKSAQ